MRKLRANQAATARFREIRFSFFHRRPAASRPARGETSNGSGANKPQKNNALEATERKPGRRRRRRYQSHRRRTSSAPFFFVLLVISRETTGRAKTRFNRCGRRGDQVAALGRDPHASTPSQECLPRRKTNGNRFRGGASVCRATPIRAKWEKPTPAARKSGDAGARRRAHSKRSGGGVFNVKYV